MRPGVAEVTGVDPSRALLKNASELAGGWLSNTRLSKRTGVHGMRASGALLPFRDRREPPESVGYVLFVRPPGNFPFLALRASPTGH